jgi:hypothetical protein
MNWVKHPLELRHLGVLSGASKMISEPTVCLAQTMHLSCPDNNNISKWSKRRFHMTHVTLEFHRVRPNQSSEPLVLSAETMLLTCVKIGTILNELNQAST